MQESLLLSHLHCVQPPLEVQQHLMVHNGFHFPFIFCQPHSFGEVISNEGEFATAHMVALQGLCFVC